MKSEICTIVPANQDGFRPLVFGMGFLVSDREILTCAHVIVAALGEDWAKGVGKVRLCFPFIEGPQGDSLCVDGSVDRSRWLAPGPPLPGKPTDIAVVKLEQDAPSSVKRAVLRDHKNDARVKIYGFRGKELASGAVSHPEGEVIEGIILGPLPGGRGQFDGIRDTGATVEKGFSGSGVYDPKHDALVGMIVEADMEKPRKIAQFIDMPSLKQALGKVAASPPTGTVGSRTASKSLLVAAQNKMREIETYLQEIAEILPQPDPDRGLTTLLESILFGGPDADRLRVAFGFTAKPEKLHGTFELAAGGDQSVAPLLGIWAQRVDQALWRYKYTLEYIESTWAAEAGQRADELRTICAPHLPARQPGLSDISAVIVDGSKDLKAFIEYAPDATLYAVMRSFKHAHDDTLSGPEPGSGPALDFLFNYIQDLERGVRSIDDSSNAWWAVRIGICRGQERFRGLLSFVAEKLDDVRIPSEEISRLAPMPEIYKPIRTISYTLSNVQAILQCDREIDGELRNRLHDVIATVLDRLLKTPRSNQLYLASVHHEGLRNYFDYFEEQGLGVESNQAEGPELLRHASSYTLSDSQSRS
jgi:hypothetical protein